jgi:hypothetical protein
VTVQTPTGGALQLVQLGDPGKEIPTEPMPLTPPLTAQPLAAGPPTQDFTMTLTPSSATTVPGGTVAFQVTLTTTDGKPFTGKADLAVSGQPAGVKAAFQPPVLAGGSEIATLTLDIGTTVPAGAYPFTVTASAKEGLKTVSGALTVLPAGTTALTGTILETGKKPLPNVTTRLGGLSTKTDAGGHFLLVDPPTGEQLVFLDGATASTATAVYPLIPVKVTILKGRVTPLPYTPHLHAQKTKDFMDIRDKGKARKLKDPSLPEFELHIPPGAEIKGWDGKLNERVTVMTLPSDRLPIPPLPKGIKAPRVFMFFFDKPGGGVPSEPIPVTLPNDLGLKPGDQAILWYFDEAPNLEDAIFDWRPFGTGTVSPDGKTIVSDPGAGIPRFCCGAVTASSGPDSGSGGGDCGSCGCEGKGSPCACQGPGGGGGAGGGGGDGGGGGAGGGGGGGGPAGPTAGDPVETTSGAFFFRTTDLVLPGPRPVAFIRTYRSRDVRRTAMGWSMSHNFEVYLQGDA